MSLEAALQLAYENNLKVQNASLEVQRASDAVDAATTKFFPSLHFDTTVNYNLTEQSYSFQKGTWGTYEGIGPIPRDDIDIETQSGFTTILSARLSQPLSQLYRIDLNVEQHRIKMEMAQEELRAQQQSVAKEVKDAYYQVLQKESALAATEESIVFYRELNRITQHYLQEQTVLETDQLEVKTRLAKAELQALSQGNELADEKERLNNLLGRDLTAPVSVVKVPEREAYEVDLPAAQALALEQRPEIGESKLKLLHAENSRSIKVAEYIPDLWFTASYDKLYDVELIPGDLATVGILFRWEFYDWGRKQSELAARKKDVQKAQNGIKQTTDQVLLQVNKIYRKLTEARARLKVAALSRDTARAKLRVTMQQYKQKAVLLDSLLQAESDVAEANRQYEDALLAFWKTKAAFEKALGEA
ncbi:MAG: TolC family protein [Deltaproteobacteria bacterium]|nr:TolC family protein [Deltaproteobacteria bacterium]